MISKPTERIIAGGILFILIGWVASCTATSQKPEPKIEPKAEIKPEPKSDPKVTDRVFTPAESRAAITASEILSHILYLASDALKGREAGTPECDLAADYVAGEFKKAGLRPAGPDGYFQPFQIALSKGLGKKNRLDVVKGDTRFSGRVKEDFVPFGFSANAKVSGDVVFAGYGITAPEKDYDDYAGLDVKGKIVLLLRYEPGEKDAKSPFDGKNHTAHAEFRTKVAAAVKQGAAGMMIVTGPRYHGKEKDVLQKVYLRIMGVHSIPVVLITRGMADKLVALGGKKLADLQDTIDTTYKPASFPIQGARLTLQTELIREKAATRNVVGLLPGSDEELKDELIVIGAHYDHIGARGFASTFHGDPRGKIHNGADDNASGTAALMEIAQALAARPEPPRRSILFIAFSAEEKGLRGSNYYVKHPIFPLARTVAMINMDMVGRMKKEKLTVSGVGTSPAFDPILDAANREIGLTLSRVQGGNAPSDSTSFYVKKIPILFFFTGGHADYHRPSDDWDKINTAGAERVARLVEACAVSLADGETRPAYVRNDGGFRPMGGGNSKRAWFGILPEIDMDATDGVLVESVTEKSPAALGGVQEGDRIIQLGAMKIGNLSDMSRFLQKHKAGETVKVVVQRDGQPVELKVTLANRPG